VIAALLPRLVIWLWFFAALLAGPALLSHLPPVGLPVTIGLLTLGFLRLAYRLEGVREWITSLPLRTLLLLHVSRLTGCGLLVFHLRGIIDGDFAIPIGLGEIAVGCMALPVALAPLSFTQRLRAATVWNIAGLTELLLAIGLATRLAHADPDFFRSLSLPPTVVVPLFAAPLLLSSHVVIFMRTRSAPPEADAATPGQSASKERGR
jgi:hypothetical protein